MAKKKVVDKLIGSVTTEQCPSCPKGRLFRNALGHEWCSQLDCDYHMVRKTPRSKKLIPAHEKLSLRNKS